MVTGATGFVGEHLCRLLLSRGVPVRAAVRRALEQTMPGLEVAPDCSLPSGPGWSAAMEGVDCVVHCAAQVPPTGKAHPVRPESYYQVNVEGTLTVARAAVAAGVRRFVLLSSIKVQGESTDGRGPFTEADEPAPSDAYGQSKWHAEQALHRLAAATGLDVVVVRCPLVYGPGVGGNFRSLLKLADSPWPLPLGGIGNARSMVFVGNLVDFLAHVVRAEKAAGGTFLVSDGEDLSTSELIQRLRTTLHRPPRLIPVPWLNRVLQWAGKGAAASRLMGSLQVDSARARVQLGWQPPFSVDEGLAETAKWSGGE